MTRAAPHESAKLAEARAEIQMRVRQAAAIAKGLAAGNMPAGLKRIIKRLTKPVVDESLTRDFSWAKPNRRFLSAGMILPGLVNDGIDQQWR